ncbi:hypothetical protein EDB89DRAFT_1275734 [Lactarius sanguifluus]|nr:hypothetical protein EDB89DRAFT_1275734 [Lactarius sanguifluus]
MKIASDMDGSSWGLNGRILYGKGSEPGAGTTPHNPAPRTSTVTDFAPPWPCPHLIFPNHLLLYSQPSLQSVIHRPLLTTCHWLPIKCCFATHKRLFATHYRPFPACAIGLPLSLFHFAPNTILPTPYHQSGSPREGLYLLPVAIGIGATYPHRLGAGTDVK